MDLAKFINNNKEKMISDIMEFVRIPSVYEPESVSPDKPFGESIDQGLKWILNKAQSFGMNVKNYNGYVGEANAGTGDYVIGILAHEDVVAEGNGWNTPPFEPCLKDGKIYGRGTSDDKGPLISSLYAVKYLMENGKIPENGCIRLIIGADEEEKWRCIDYYVENAETLPNYSIVPDGYFPMIFCEKGLIDFDLNIPFKSSAGLDVIELDGGSGRNIVPGSAKCKIRCSKNEADRISDAIRGIDNIDCKYDNNCMIINSLGKSTHAMSPEKGINAISYLFEALGNVPYPLTIDPIVDKYRKLIGLGFNGEKMNMNFSDELSGMLTLNIGQVYLESDNFILKCNMRYPATYEKNFISKALLSSIADENVAYEEVAYIKPVYIDPDSDFMKTLLGVYQDVTKDMDTKPFAIGGATYARGIPNAVAYGPLFPGEEELAHEANEFISVESLEKMTEIYIKALEKILEIK